LAVVVLVWLVLCLYSPSAIAILFAYSLGTDGADIEGGEGEAEEELDEVEKMRRSLAQIEAEAKQLEEMQLQAESAMPSEVDKAELDSRSVFIGNV
jgi:hypothetical protein